MSVHGPLGATDTGGVEIRSRALAVRTPWVNTRTGMLGLAGLLATTLLVALAAAGTNTLLPESVRPVPSWLAGPFGRTGIDLGNGGLIVVLLLMFGSYVLAAHAAERLSARTVLMAIAAMHALVLLAPPLLSTDVFSYQFYGRIAEVYGANPYLVGPHALAVQPSQGLFPFIGERWISIPTVYGPLFTALSYVMAPLSIASSVVAYKAIAACASLGTVAIVYKAARLRGINPVKAAALVGLNPLVVIYGVGGGHNDLLMLLPLVAGVYLILLQRDRWGGAMMVTAAAIKVTGGLPLAFAFASGRGMRGRDRRRGVLIGAGLATALFAGLSFVWFGTGPLHLVSTLHKVQGEADWQSIPGFIGTRFGLGSVGKVTGFVLDAVFVIVFCWLLRRVWRGELDWIDASAWAAVAVLACASSLLPWYAAWLMPFAALGHDRRLWRLALIGTGVVLCIQLVSYLPDGGAFLGI
jgi:hypothetical protein